jgi:predicted molibdopterin-dependent oxidoreductase YjgC
MNISLAYDSAQQIFEELSVTVHTFSGVSYARIDDDLGVSLVNSQQEAINLA